MPHVHDKIDFTAEAFVVHNGKVLLRIHDKYKIWLGVGGHIELDEDPNQAVIREVKEEVGLDVQLIGKHLTEDDGSQELVPPAFVNRHRISDTHEHIAFIFFATSETDQVVEQESEKSDQLHWFTKADLESDIFPVSPRIKTYALAALAAAA